MPSWHNHDRDCPKRYPQTDEYCCTCGASGVAAARRENERLRIEAENARLRREIEGTRDPCA